MTLPSGRRQTLAALLAFGPGGGTSDGLVEAIWPGELPKEYGASLRMAMSRLRTVLPPDALSMRSYLLQLRLDQVDLWHLAELAASGSVPDESDLLWALAGEPYPEVELSLAIAGAASAARRDQQRLVERFCATHPATISDPLCDRLEKFVEREVVDDDLAIAVGRLLVDTGRPADGYRLLQRFVERFDQEMGRRPRRVEELLSRLQERLAGSEDSSAVGRPSSPGPAPSFPDPLAELRGRVVIGRDRELADLASAGRSLMLGPRGAGKSQLLSELADDAIRLGHQVVHLQGSEDVQLPFGPFLTGLTEIRGHPAWNAPTRLAAVARGDDDAAHRIDLEARFLAVLALLERRAAGTALLVLVDDAHHLDGPSLALLRLLTHAESEARLRFCVAGRTDVQDPRWRRWCAESIRLGMTAVELVGLSLDGLHAIVLEHFPDATFEAQRALAVEVLRLSGGLPVVAVPLIAAADPRTLSLPTRVSTSANLHWRTAELPDDLRDVAMAAALLGHVFSVGELVALYDRPTDVVEAALDRLLVEGLVVETDDPDRLRFQHVLLRDAFVDTVPPFRRRQLSRAAAAVSDDPHAVARHLATALPSVPGADAVAALTRSARLHADRREWRRAANQLRHAEAVDGQGLSVADLTLYAEALDLSGQDGSEPRRAAVRGATQVGAWAQVLDAALAGLPAAERPDGDPERAGMLERIPPDELEPRDRFRHAVTLSRLLSLNGSPQAGLAWAGTALDLAGDDAQARCLAQLARWTAHHHIAPGGYDLPDELGASADVTIALRINQLRAITALERNRLADSRELHLNFTCDARRSGDPLRVWHALSFESLLAFEDGRVGRSRQLADQAYRHGLLHDFQAATTVWLGQLFSHAFALRVHDQLLTQFGQVQANVARSKLSQAALALSLWAAGDRAKAADMAASLVGDALDRPRSLSPVVVALMSEIVGAGRDRSMILAARRLLLPYLDSSLVVGFGVASTGPVGRYLVPLAVDEAERRTWLDHTVAASESLGSAAWQVLNLVLRGVMLDNSADLAWADDLARATDFQVGAIAERWRAALDR